MRLSDCNVLQYARYTSCRLPMCCFLTVFHPGTFRPAALICDTMVSNMLDDVCLPSDSPPLCQVNLGERLIARTADILAKVYFRPL